MQYSGKKKAQAEMLGLFRNLGVLLDYLNKIIFFVSTNIFPSFPAASSL